jgi:GDP/UDP-N,N'-diacetylbacillosamine 2-epimerase (hydrolysing)
LKKGAVNIGSRQDGRVRAASVIDCAPRRAAISAAVDRLFSAEFRESLARVRNPYGESGASDRIVDIIRSYPLKSLVPKAFFDLPESSSHVIV